MGSGESGPVIVSEERPECSSRWKCVCGRSSRLCSTVMVGKSVMFVDNVKYGQDRGRSLLHKSSPYFVIDPVEKLSHTISIAK